MGHMSGPFPLHTVPQGKVNSLISVPKADGGRRQIGNLSAPPKMSFNDGIRPETLQAWRVVQTTAKQFAEMIRKSGKGCLISCCDMVAAYKTLPVCEKQRRLQIFHFLEKEFIDLRMIFGDQATCMNYDRYHLATILFFVLPKAPLPLRWIGRTVDDITTAVPRNAGEMAQRFVDTYKEEVTNMGVGVAPDDPDRRKAFSCATSGEVLGVWFDTVSMTWQLPRRKLTTLLAGILEAAALSAKLNLHEVEVLHGRLVNFAQLVPPIKLFTGEIIAFLRDLLQVYSEEKAVSRSERFVLVPPSMKHDLKTIACIVWDTIEFPLPIGMYGPPILAGAVPVFTDISGHLLANPSLGIYSPGDTGEGQALVVSLAFPRYFLLAEDESGHKVFNKTTSLEALGPLATLCLDPLRFTGREVTFTIDNAATVICLEKGYSKGDPWATTVARATRVVAAGINSSVCDLGA